MNRVCRADGMVILQETRKSTMFAAWSRAACEREEMKKEDAHDSGNSSDYTFYSTQQGFVTTAEYVRSDSSE
jgi:hypothetical protein